MFVKICGITNEDDALLAVAMGADAVGFKFAPGRRARSLPRSPTTSPGDSLPRSSPSGCSATSCPTRVVELAHKSGVKAVQLHGNETRRAVHRGCQAVPLGDQGVQRWRSEPASRGSVRHRHGDDRRRRTRARARCSTGRSSATHPMRCKLILAGGLTPENVAAAIHEVRPWGVDVCERRGELAGTEGRARGEAVHRERTGRRAGAVPRR